MVQVENAARLVYLGLKAQSPWSSVEYKRLLQEYRRDSEFQHVVDSVATGMHLKVLHVEENLGIMLCPESDSVFTYSMRDGVNLSKELKSIWGLVLLSIAAYLYPKAESFNETDTDEVVSLTPEQLDKYIRERCELVGACPADDVLASEASRKEIMYRRYMEHVAVVGGSEKSRSTTTSLIKRVFQFLQEKRLMLERDDGSFAVLPTFKYLMRELSTNEHMLAFIQDRDEGTGDDEDGDGVSHEPMNEDDDGDPGEGHGGVGEPMEVDD